MKRLSVFARVASVVLCGLTASLRAAPFDDRVPANAVVYAGWQGAEALAPQYQNSNLKMFAASSTLGAWIHDQLPLLLDKANQGDPEAAAAFTRAQTLLQILWRHPTAIYAGPLDFEIKPGAHVLTPSFRAGLICDAGEEANALVDLITQIRDKIPDNTKVNLQIGRDGTNQSIVIVTVGNVSPKDFNVSTTALRSVTEYKNALKQVDGDGAVVVYMDVKAAVNTVADGINKAPDAPPQVREKFAGVIDALGMNGLSAVSFSAKFSDKTWVEKSFLAAPSPRAGVLALLDTPPVRDEMLARVPKDAASFSLAHFSLPAVLALARDVMGKTSPEVLEHFNAAMAENSKELSIDLEKDVINGLGDEWTYYRFTPPYSSQLSIVMANKLKDPAGVSRALAAMETLINTKAQSQVVVEKITVGENVDASTIHVLQYSVGWAVYDGYLYVSDASGIGPAIEHVQQKQESILASENFKAFRAAMPNKNPSTITFAEPSRIYPEMHRNLLMLLGYLRLGAKINVPSSILPDPAKAGPALTPGGIISWSDGDGFHAYSNTAIPGAAVLAREDSAEGWHGVAELSARRMPVNLRMISAPVMPGSRP